MPVTTRVLRVFLSSPGDVGEQRAIVRAVIDELNADPLVSERCRLEVVAWDSEGAAVPLSAGRTPQESVNAYLALPRECDLTIVLLWGRIGTPLPPEHRRADGTTYESGTVWELEDARSAGREVWIYRYARPPQIELDDPEEEQKKEQYRRVKAFVASSRAADGSLSFGVNEFQHGEQFQGLLRGHLKHFLSKAAPADGPLRSGEPPVVSAPVASPDTPIGAAERADRLGHLIHLCDREDVRDLFIHKIRERILLARSAGGILCILPGGTREGHRGFLECVRDYEIRRQIPGVTPEQVVLVPVFGKLPLGTVDTLGISILRGIRDGVQRPKLESWQDLQRWMSSEQRRIFILALEPTSDAVRGKERLFLDNATAWLSRWLDRPARQVFVLVACIRYAGGADGGNLASERARLEDELAGFTLPEPGAASMPEIVRLPELPSITSEYINLWLDHDAVKPLSSAAFRANIRQLFAQRPSWSIDDLRDRLDTPD